FNGSSHWWSQTGGTSMAAPIVSGAMALWRQGNPYLTVEEVIDIIRSTAVVDNDVESCPEPRRWGAGKFDAYAGLKEVIRRSGVNSIHGEGSGLLLVPEGVDSYKVSLPGVMSLALKVYAADGRLVKGVSSSGDTMLLDLSALDKGVYVVTANSLASARIIVK
ncbi:MAG: S8 family peptidase, partial [Muribaculaceae bacterium]|nr:S8 family peptidase [Muribaculaceae bacterium]